MKALLERLEEEQDNLRAVLRWAGQSDGMDTERGSNGDAKVELGLRLATALAWFWRGRRHTGEGREYLLVFLAMPQPERHGAPSVQRLRANALVWASAFTCDQGDFAQARLFAKESLAIARELGDKPVQARAFAELAAAAGYQGDLLTAYSNYEESLTLNRELSDEAGISNALRNLGYLAMMSGDYVGARALLEETLALSRKLADEHSIGFALENLGELAYHAGDYETASRVMGGKPTCFPQTSRKISIGHSTSPPWVRGIENWRLPRGRIPVRGELVIMPGIGC